MPENMRLCRRPVRKGYAFPRSPFSLKRLRLDDEEAEPPRDLGKFSTVRQSLTALGGGTAAFKQNQSVQLHLNLFRTSEIQQPKLLLLSPVNDYLGLRWSLGLINRNRSLVVRAAPNHN